MGNTDEETGAPRWVVWLVGFFIGACFLLVMLMMSWAIILMVQAVMKAA